MRFNVTKESMPSLAYGVNNGRQLRQPGDFLVPHKVVGLPVNTKYPPSVHHMETLEYIPGRIL